MSVSYLELAGKKRLDEVNILITQAEGELSWNQNVVDQLTTKLQTLELERDELIRELAELDG